MLIPREQGLNQTTQQPFQQGMIQFGQPQQGMPQFGSTQSQQFPQQSTVRLGYIQQPMQGFAQPTQQSQQFMSQFGYAQPLSQQEGGQPAYIQQPLQVFAQPFQQPQQQHQQHQQSQFGYAQPLPQQGSAQLEQFQQPLQRFSQGISQDQQWMAQQGYPQQQPQQDFGGQAGQLASSDQTYQQSQPRKAQAEVLRARRGPKNYTRSDERINELICEGVIQDLSIDVSDVSIEVEDGRVTLNGTVPHRQMKHAIEDVVDQCWGVQEIENKLRVQSCQESGNFAQRNPDQEGRTISQSGGGFTNSSGASESGGSRNSESASQSRPG